MYILIMFQQNKSKAKFEFSSREAFLNAMADAECDEAFDYTLDESKIPLPTELLAHEIDNDVVLQDTLLNLCDSEGMPFKYKYLVNDCEDMMEILKCDDFLDKMPMSDEFNYFVARDYMGCPISKREIDRSAFERRVYEKRAMAIIDKSFTLKSRPVKIATVETFKKETRTLDF